MNERLLEVMKEWQLLGAVCRLQGCGVQIQMQMMTHTETADILIALPYGMLLLAM